MSSLLVGDIVEPITHVAMPQRMDYRGEFITMSPVSPEADAQELFECSHGSEMREQIWTYMGYGPIYSTSNAFNLTRR